MHRRNSSLNYPYKKLLLLSSSLLLVCTSVYSQDNTMFDWATAKAYYYYGAFNSILLFMLFISIIRFIFSKDKAYWYYSLYVLFNILFFVFWYASKKEDFSFYPAKEFPVATETIFKVALLLGYATYYYFIIYFFKLWERDHYLGGKLRNFAFIYFGLLAIDLLSGSAWYLGVWSTDNYTALRVFILTLSSIVGFAGYYYALQIKDKLMPIIITSSLLYVMGSIGGFLCDDILELDHNSLLYNFPILPTQIGFLLEVVFFSIGLSYRTTLLEEENNLANSQLIEQLKTNQQLELDKLEIQRLKDQSEFKAKLYTNITHELRTPLTIIAGMSDRISDGQTKRILKKNSQQLLSLVNRILDLKKISSGEVALEYIQADFMLYLKYLIDSYESHAQAHNKTVSFYSEPSSLLMDYEPTQIQHLIDNLLSNALKFTNEYGKIQVSARYLVATKQIEIEVSDNGIGIAEEELPNIFDRFYQGNAPTSDKGSGIGLALVKEVMQLLNGDIQVKSQVDKGTTFTLLLPITNKAEISTQPIITKEEPSSTKQEIPATVAVETITGSAEKDFSILPRLLIVEDSTNILEYLSNILDKDYQISTARTGTDGLAKATENLPDIIISDILLPEKDGYQLCESLKNNQLTCHIPIVLLTAKSTKSAKIKGLQKGADAYLTKPFNNEELFYTLAQLLANRKRLKQYYLQDKTANADDINNEFLQKMYGIIEKNYTDADFNLPQLCQKLFLSRTQVYRKVKQLTNRGPAELLKEYRLQKSRQLLMETKQDLSTIAQMVGFRDSRYFTKVYKENFGEDPTMFLS